MVELIEHAGMNYRTYVANDDYDKGKLVADLLWEQGLRAEHTVVDIGAGSLRVGRWLIENVGPENYFYIEPNLWLIEEAIKHDGLDLSGVRGCTGIVDFDVQRCFGKIHTFDYGFISAVLIHVDHATLRKALFNSKAGCRTLIFDTFPQGPDWTGEGWLYPEIAPHYDDCVLMAATGLGKLTKLHIDYRGAQWWSLI